jgi:hypothetical protein
MYTRVVRVVVVAFWIMQLMCVKEYEYSRFLSTL